MAIQQSTPFLLLLVVVISARARAEAAAGGPSSVITSTCHALAASRPQFPAANDICVRALSGYPAAASATDARGLAVATANLMVANVTRTEGLLKDLIGDLQKCFKLYKGLRATAAGGVEDLRAGHDDAAVAKLSMSLEIPEVCLIPFTILGKPCPVGDEVQADGTLSELTSAIIQLLKPAHKV